MASGFSRRQILSTIGSLFAGAAAQKVVPTTQLEQVKAAPAMADNDPDWYERVREIQKRTEERWAENVRATAASREQSKQWQSTFDAKMRELETLMAEIQAGRDENQRFADELSK